MYKNMLFTILHKSYSPRQTASSNYEMTCSWQAEREREGGKGLRGRRERERKWLTGQGCSPDTVQLLRWTWTDVSHTRPGTEPGCMPPGWSHTQAACRGETAYTRLGTPESHLPCLLNKEQRRLIKEAQWKSFHANKTVCCSVKERQLKHFIKSSHTMSLHLIISLMTHTQVIVALGAAIYKKGGFCFDG